MTSYEKSRLFVWRDAILSDQANDLSATARLVAMALAKHMDRFGRSCHPSVELLTIETNTDRRRRTVQAALKELEEHGWIVRKLGGGRGRPSSYEARFPLNTAAVETAAPDTTVSENRPDPWQETGSLHGKNCLTPRQKPPHEMRQEDVQEDAQEDVHHEDVDEHEANDATEPVSYLGGRRLVSLAESHSIIRKAATNRVSSGRLRLLLSDVTGRPNVYPSDVFADELADVIAAIRQVCATPRHDAVVSSRVDRPAPTETEQRMTFRYELKTADGDDAGTFRSTRCDWQPGDEFIGHGNTRWRILRIVPRDLIAEFHDSPEVELWEVERL